MICVYTVYVQKLIDAGINYKTHRTALLIIGTIRFGELERDIRGFEQVKFCRVNILVHVASHRPVRISQTRQKARSELASHRFSERPTGRTFWIRKERHVPTRRCASGGPAPGARAPLFILE